MNLAWATVGFLSCAQIAVAAEIVTQCPDINDGGSRIETAILLPEPLTPIELERNWVPNARDILETKQIFWRRGMEPITDATFFCTFKDGNELYVPVVGMLLYCRTWIGRYTKAENAWTRCTSETDPGLLLK